METYDPHIEAALQESNGYANPFILTRDPVAILAYHQYEGNTLDQCQNEATKIGDLLKKIANQGTADDGALNLAAIDAITGSDEDKSNTIIALNSRLHGVMQALQPKRKKAQLEEMHRRQILDIGGTIDDDGKAHRPRVLSPSDIAALHLRDQGIQLGSADFRQRAVGAGPSVAWETNYNPAMSARRFLNAVFTTGNWDPDIPDQPGWVPARQTPLQIMDIITVFMTNKDAVDWMEENVYGAGGDRVNINRAAETAEGGMIPESEYGVERRTTPVERIAHFLPITEEALDDEPQVRSYLDYLMPLGVQQRLDGQILNGTGGSNQLRGILAGVTGVNPTGDDQTANRAIQRQKITRTGSHTGAIVGNPWSMLLDASYQIQDHGFGILGMQMPTHALLHPNIYRDCLKAESTAGGYYVGGPQSPMMKSAWGMTVVETNHLTIAQSTDDAVANNKYSGVIGDFSPMFVRLWMRHEVRTEVGMMNDNFRRFLLSMRSSVRCAFALTRASAMIGLVNPKSDGSAPAN